MVQRVNAPKLAPPTKSGPSQRIVAIWKGTTRTKQPGELEPGVYALFDIAFWVASNLDSITSLSDPHPALRSVRTELDHLADRLTRKLGVKSVRVTDITVEVHARGYKLRAALNSARATWRYQETWGDRPGMRIADHGAVEANSELKRLWSTFLTEMTDPETYSLKVNQRAKASTLDEIDRLARGADAQEREQGRPGPGRRSSPSGSCEQLRR
jgi:hypothetical protein